MVLLESIGCVQLAWELETRATVLLLSSGFNKESHLYSLLQPSPASNLSQGTLQIYYFFVVSNSQMVFNLIKSKPLKCASEAKVLAISLPKSARFTKQIYGCVVS